MEYKVYSADTSELQFTPTEAENVVLRTAIRKQLAAAATGQYLLKHEAAISLIHYLDITVDDQSPTLTVRCSRRHIDYMRDAVEATMPDFSPDEMVVADQVVQSFKSASIESEARTFSMKLPDFVPDDL